MKKVLILGIAPVQMDAIIELKKMGVKTYACAQANDGPGSIYADHFQLINFTEVDRVIEFIQEHEIDCVYSVGSDIAIPISAAISEKMGLPHFVSSRTAKICNNKIKMREFLGNDFDGNIKFQLINNINDKIELSYPFIMKPSDSQGQRGVRLIKDYNEFQQHFEACKRFSREETVIIEEYIEGPELSVNAYMIDGDIAFFVPSDRVVWPQFQGGLIRKHVVPSKVLNSSTNERVKDLVCRVAKKLGIVNGPLYFQIKMKDDQPFIIEVTPRLDGCHMWNVLRYYTGVNLIKLTFEHLLFGNTDELYNCKKFEGQYTLEFLCDAPNKQADYTNFNIPSNTLFSFKYYNDGDLIRAINGQFEKIGYYIIQD
ncbi:ATP-grasp domain-containing protein [Saccharococcus caldoxylosilyticus]|uniref:ATP-grasp domain-containing protein n=1 Tax=Parageobacillus caldoxylosilyticus NBRC 107762 TaxID=1220594 RepID=A0A023DB59_9BACL|nr:ATP-grasp domain-containing protein [Parageobacillus caldoxylosilyticus]MBB3851068.1 biotin carboxylase [Parageobacillus caldoxylosilyticus]GAJ38347.1 hypothetical protein GCA01S_003_00140 [Parageobacillus caldoxylosilyticus NBRC 107762]